MSAKTSSRKIARSKTGHKPSAIIESNSPKGTRFEQRDLPEESELPENPAWVKVGGGLTKNLGEYESAKLFVSVEIPCGISDKKIRAAYKRASGLVDAFLEEEYKNVIG